MARRDRNEDTGRRPLGAMFGFVVPPPAFHLLLIPAVAAYMLLVEAVRRAFLARATKQPL